MPGSGAPLRMAIASAVLAVALALLLTRPAAHAETSDLFGGGGVDGGFEAGGGGWTVVGPFDVAFDGSGPTHDGAAAAHLYTAVGGLLELRSAYWLTPTVAGAEHTLRGHVLADGTGLDEMRLTLEFLDEAGLQLAHDPAEARVEGDAPGYRALVAGPLVAPAGTAFARATLRASSVLPEATLHIDSMELERGLIPTPTATPTPTSTPTATATATATATSTPTATPTPTSTPTPVYVELINGGFELGTLGWSKVGGTVATGGGFLGDDPAGVIVSQSSGTKRISQRVTVTPGGWYEASAHLLAGVGAELVWLRVAWYANVDGTGSQLATVDSEALAGPFAEGHVSTEPMRAPIEARTAQVRLLLRPGGEALAILAVDDVRFDPATEPTPPTPTPTPSPSPSPSPAATPRSVAATPTASPLAAPSTPSTPSVTPGGAVAPQQPAAPALDVARETAREAAATPPMLRITELLPDPLAPGADAAHEWVELANLGEAPALLGGLVLRDNETTVALPEVTLPAGAAIVIGGPLAAVERALLYRPAGGLGRGLANDGDRLALLDAKGQALDTLSYGDDPAYRRAEEPPHPAPGPGRSLRRHFDAAGRLLAVEVADTPSPGVIETAPSASMGAAAPAAASTAEAADVAEPPQIVSDASVGVEPTPPATPDRVAAGDARGGAWLLLVLLASGALLGAAAHRALAILSERRD